MSNYSVYNNIIENKIANTSEVFYDEDMKKSEINNTISELLRMYDIPDMRKRGTITFDSDGLAPLPDDYFRMIKLWTVNALGTELNEFQYIYPDEMDDAADSQAYWWTEDYIPDSSDRRLIIRPTDSGTVQIRYVKRPNVIETTTDESGLSSDWDEPIALGTSYRLFSNAGRYDEANLFLATYEKSVARAWQTVSNRGGFKQNNKIRSVFDRKSILGGFRNRANSRRNY